MNSQRGIPLTGYELWLRDEGLSVFTGHSVADINAVEMATWTRLGGRGAYIDLDGSEGITGMWIGEIPPGTELEPEKHLYEEIVYVLEGTGTTDIWQTAGEQPTVVAWQPGSLFSPPINTWHRFRNTDSNKRARILAVTTAPFVLDMFYNREFIFGTEFNFKDRFNKEPAYFAPTEVRRSSPANDWYAETNFVADARTIALNPDGLNNGVSGTFFELSENSLAAHVAELAPGSRTQAHYHGGGSHMIVLSGSGFSLLWSKELGAHPYQDGNGDSVMKIDWHEGSIISPPDGWYHQHFNLGAGSARLLSVRFGGRKHLQQWALDRNGELVGGAIAPNYEGRSLIAREEEDPEIRSKHDAALGKA